MKKLKFISGGQSGVDISGVEAAKQCGFETGGTMPKGFLTEYGPEPSYAKTYGMVEHKSDKYPPRTAKNIADSDITFIFSRSHTLYGGTLLTKNLCEKMKKDYKIIVLPKVHSLLHKHEWEQNFIELREILEREDINIVNIAGPRASKESKIELQVIDFMIQLLEYYKDYQRFKVIEGDLIKMALKEEFEAIAHGINCFCTQKAGISKQFDEAFKTSLFPSEEECYFGDINKLGNIEYEIKNINLGKDKGSFNLNIINCYTQYDYGRDPEKVYLDYEALTLCMRKINHEFKGKHIGLPLIGCGLAGGRWDLVEKILRKELKDCKVTIVKLKK